MTLMWGFRSPEQPSEGRPDFPRAGVCTIGGHLAPAVWQYGDGNPGRAICQMHRERLIAAAVAQPLYAKRTECPNWSHKANPKHEHGWECLI